MAKRFNDDHIRRRDIPVDCFMLLHDLCYHHEGRDIDDYVLRAQQILSSDRDMKDLGYKSKIGTRGKGSGSRKESKKRRGETTSARTGE